MKIPTNLYPEDILAPTAQSSESSKQDQERAAKYWADAERIVVAKILNGGTINDIVRATGYPKTFVKSIANKESINKQVEEATREILSEKIPILREICDLSLTAVRDWLKETMAPGNEGLKKARIWDSKDVKTIADIAIKLNDMMRLELGKQTSSNPVVQYNFDQAKILMQTLREKDPVFEYPQIADAKTKKEKKAGAKEDDTF